MDSCLVVHPDILGSAEKREYEIHDPPWLSMALSGLSL